MLTVLILLSATFLYSPVLAPITTVTPFVLNLNLGEALRIQETEYYYTIGATTVFNATGCTVNSDGIDATLNFYASCDSQIETSTDADHVEFYVNGVLLITHEEPFTLQNGDHLEIIIHAQAFVPSNNDFVFGGDITLLLTYLIHGDLLGFLVACYTTRIGQFFWVLVVAIFGIPLYMRSQSFIYVCIVFILLGPVLQAGVPFLSYAMVFCEILGIGGLIYRMVTKE